MLYAQRKSDGLDLSMFRKVSLRDRFLSRFYDTMIFWLMYIIISLLLSTVIPSLKLQPLGKLFAINFSLLWFLFRDGMRDKTSWGKQHQDIIVICSDSLKDCTLFRSFIRNIISEVAALAILIQFSNYLTFSFAYAIVLLVDIWQIVNTPNGKRMGDITAKTQVVYLDDLSKYRESFKQ